MKLEKFEDLHAWQEARALVGLVYRITMPSVGLDRDLVRQMRRAATSTMSNIAEGFARYSFKDSKQFFITSRGSLAELRSQMYVALDQGYLTAVSAEELGGQIEIVGRLLWGLIRNARRQLAKGGSRSEQLVDLRSQ